MSWIISWAFSTQPNPTKDCRVPLQIDRGESLNLRAAKLWMGLALGALLLGGVLSFFLVFGRTPVINEFVEDLQFIKKILVIHVILTLEVWFLGFFTALFLTLPGKSPGITTFLVACVGVAMFVASGFIPGVDPILSNYIPIMNHPVFFVGIALFHGAVALNVLGSRLHPVVKSYGGEQAILPPDSQVGLKYAGVIYLLGLVVFGLAFYYTPSERDPAIYYEFLFWGGGHVFQFVNIAAVISVWMLLLNDVTGSPILRRNTARITFTVLVLPVIASVSLTARGTVNEIYYHGFISIMRWGTWPAYVVFLLIAFRAIYRMHKEDRLYSEQIFSSSFIGFFWSAVLVLLGIALGVLISRSTTLIPAHYHATIGSVTVAFMAATYLLLEKFGYSIPTGRLKRLSIWQPAIYGVGQFSFAVGFAMAGLYGLERKTFGQEQVIRTAEQLIGLGVMGVGGVLAIAGGGLFIYIVAKTWFRKPGP